MYRHAQFWWERLKSRKHFRYLGTDWRIVSKWVLRKKERLEGDTIQPSQEKAQQRPFMNTSIFLKAGTFSDWITVSFRRTILNYEINSSSWIALRPVARLDHPNGVFALTPSRAFFTVSNLGSSKILINTRKPE
jgi:hypothetical protein